MPILWTLLLILCVGLLLAVALKCGEQLALGTVARSRSFWCPFRNRNVIVQFEETACDGHRLAVCRCSAFAPPTAIACDQLCVTLVRFPATHRTVTI